MLVMAALIAIVGGLGLMGTMSINVLERTREIGVMRAIGASNLRYSKHRDRGRHGDRFDQLGDQHPGVHSDHGRSVLRRRDGDPDRTHARRLRRDRDHCLADLHPRPGHDRKCTAGPRASRLTVRDTLAYE